MYYGYEENNTLMICAHLEVNEYKNYKTVLTEQNISFEKTGMEEQLFDSVISKFRIPLYRLKFDNHILKNVFLEGNPNVKIVTFDQALEMHNYMIDYETKNKFMKDNNKTIAELAGIDKVDPWDKRTEEEKEKQAEASKNKKAYGEQLTGQSFDPKLSVGREGFNINKIDTTDLSNIKVSATKKGKAKEQEQDNPFEE